MDKPYPTIQVCIFRRKKIKKKTFLHTWERWLTMSCYPSEQHFLKKKKKMHTWERWINHIHLAQVSMLKEKKEKKKKSTCKINFGVTRMYLFKFHNWSHAKLDKVAWLKSCKTWCKSLQKQWKLKGLMLRKRKRKEVIKGWIICCIKKNQSGYAQAANKRFFFLKRLKFPMIYADDAEMFTSKMHDLCARITVAWKR